VLHNLLLQAGGGRGDPAAAEAEYERAVALCPTEPYAASRFGQLLLRQQRNDEAMLQFQNARRGSGAFALAAFNAGFLLFKKRRFAEAVEAFGAATRVQPADGESFQVNH
jgi:Tfp pilus assembly protein PilF